MDDHFRAVAASLMQHTLHHDAMCQDRHGQPLDVVGNHIAAAFDKSESLGGPVQRDGPARADSELQLLVTPRGVDQIQHVIVDGIINADHSGRALQVPELIGAQDGFELVDRFAVAVVYQNIAFDLPRRIPDFEAHHEAVELVFGQWIGAFEFIRVLRGEHKERLGQRMSLALH